MVDGHFFCSGPRMLFLVTLDLDVVLVGCMMGWMEKLYVILM